MVILNGRKVIIELEEGWSVLKQGITRLTNLVEGVRPKHQEFTAREYSSLYTKAYDMASEPHPHNYAPELYERYRESLEDYLNSKVLPTVRDKLHREIMLKELARRWKDHKVMVYWLSRIFSYLEQHYVPRNRLRILTEVSVMCFRSLVYGEMKVTMKDAVIALVNCEREGEQIDQALMKNVVDIFGEMGMGQMSEAYIYEADFETFMLEDTIAFYETKALCWIQEDSYPVYMAKAEECLEQEKKRVGDYLSASSEHKLMEKVQQEVLAKYQMKLLDMENSGCLALLKRDKVDDLSRMYRLFCRIPTGLEPVAAIFRQHITDEGTALIKQVDDAATATKKKAEKMDTLGVQKHGLGFVQEALDVHDKYLRYVSECFVDHSFFHKALKGGFEDFCNKRVVGSTSAELLGSFCDNLLKKSRSRKLCDEEVEETLEKVVNILAHINDKDLFGEFCRKKLAKRLLFDKSANNDHEPSILSKLKQQCGGQFTSKMEGMLNDLEITRGNQLDFKKYLTTSQISDVGIDLSVTVLTMSKWPTYKISNVALPNEMVKCVEAYKEFYKTIIISGS